MPIIPVRGLSAGGVILDVPPSGLVQPAWSGGRNISFPPGKVTRAPLWRTIQGSLGAPDAAQPQFVFPRASATGADEIILCRNDGTLARVTSASVTEASQTGYTPTAPLTAPFTGCELAGVVYINRSDAAPRRLLPTDTRFSPLENWPSGWTCNILRQFQDTLVALNVTKSGVNGASLVDVSDIAFYGQVPGNWNFTSATSNAYETPLSRMRGPILDAGTLLGQFMIYGAHDVISMQNNGQFQYGFQTLFTDDGVLGLNCHVEVEGLHYVFGSKDCYVTDGNTKKSIATGKVRKYLYRTIRRTGFQPAFVSYNPDTDEILFAYGTNDSGFQWSTGEACSAGLVYNRVTDTWAPVDLPNIVGVCLASVDGSVTWDTMTQIWEDIGGSWADMDVDLSQHVVAATQALGTQIPSASVVAYDAPDRGSLTLPVDAALVAPSFVERLELGLDDPASGGAPVRTTKLVRAVYPEGSCYGGSSLEVQVGGHDGANSPVQWTPGDTVDMNSVTEADVIADGRFLAIRFEFPIKNDAELVGFDMDVSSNGNL